MNELSQLITLVETQVFRKVSIKTLNERNFGAVKIADNRDSKRKKQTFNAMGKNE